MTEATKKRGYMKVVLASGNPHKIKEWQAILEQYETDIELLSLKDAGICEEIEENGTTFEENARIKADAAAKRGWIGIGEDSGLAVRALNGEPGVYSARYAGEHGNDRANNERLLQNMQGITDRAAKFVCTIACAFPDGEGFCVRGETDGVILEQARGEGGFGYDPLFWYEPFGKSFAELNEAEKNAVSHRGKAIALFAEQWKQLQKNRSGQE